MFSNLSDGRISVLTPEDYSQCSIGSSLSAAIYLHTMIVPAFLPKKINIRRDFEIYEGTEREAVLHLFADQ